MKTEDAGMPAEQLSWHQAKGFMDSLFPCGEHAYLANHTTSYLKGLIGDVPMSLPAYEVEDSHRKLSQALREIATHLESKAP